MAKRFLRHRGTLFKDDRFLTDAEILVRYATIAEHFDDYARFAKGVSGKEKDRFHGHRDIRDEEGHVRGAMLAIKPQFFLNEHHREACRAGYPHLVDEIDRQPRNGFEDSRRHAWMPEFDRMVDDVPAHSRLVLFYYVACERARQGP